MSNLTKAIVNFLNSGDYSFTETAYKRKLEEIKDNSLSFVELSSDIFEGEYFKTGKLEGEKYEEICMGGGCFSYKR